MQMVLGAALLAAAAPIIQSSATLPFAALANIAVEFTSVPAKIGDDNIIRLNRGGWRELEDAGSEFTLLDTMVRGDLDEDGLEDAVIVLRQGMTGDVSHYWLVAVRNRAGRPSPLAPPMMIGDGVRIDRLSIDAGLIRVEVIEGRTAEYAGRVRFTFRVDGERVVPAAPK